MMGMVVNLLVQDKQQILNQDLKLPYSYLLHIELIEFHYALRVFHMEVKIHMYSCYKNTPILPFDLVH